MEHPVDMKSADEVIASVDATLAEWRSAFEASPRKERADGGADSGDGDVAVDDGAASSSPLPPWKDPEAYQKRLGTFKADTYYAKPLALSPLVCAAFG